MKKSELAFKGILCFLFGMVFLTGCDQLGLGPKKQDEPKKQMEASSVTVAPAALGAQEEKGPLPVDALVRIGKWTLTTGEFNNRLNLLKQQLPDFKEGDPNSKNAVLDELIRQQLMVKEAEDSNLGVSKEVKEAVDDFRKTLMVQEVASRLTKDVVASAEDARAYYGANKERFTSPTTWDVSQIVTSDEATAKGLLVQVLQGGDFAQIAQSQSKASNAAEGGKLKSFAGGHAPFEAMQTTIANLDEGGVSAVFKGPEGYYIVKVNSKKGGEIKSFTDVKKDLIYGLTMQKQQAVIFAHLRELADKYKPEYNKDLIQQTVGKLNEPGAGPKQ